jgi:hypothetical protein
MEVAVFNKIRADIIPASYYSAAFWRYISILVAVKILGKSIFSGK